MTTPSRIHRRDAAKIGLGLLAGAALTLSGCDPRQAAYFLQPFEPEIAPPCPPLKDKKVVLLGHSLDAARGDYIMPDRELIQRLSKILRDKYPKIDLVDAAKIRSWAEQHPNYTDPADAAEAFDADVVLFVEVDEFRVDSRDSPGLYFGHASVLLRAIELKHPENPKGKPVTERPKEASTIHEADVEVDFPRVQGSLPSDIMVSKTSFRNRFLDVVAAEVSWHFVPHAPSETVQNVRFTDR